MAKPFGGTLQNRVELGRFKSDDPREQYVVEARINGGMITSIDPSDLPNNALQDGKNVNVRLDKTSTIAGYTTLTPTKPNSNSIMSVYSFKKNNGEEFTLRFTASNIYRRSVAWSLLSDSTDPLSGTTSNRFSIASAFDRVFFANGVDAVKMIASDVNSYADLGNAPSYKFITSFYNRIVAAYYDPSGATPNPVQVGWSGDASPSDLTPLEEWDPLVDLTAGYNYLIESPGDTSDFITGIYGFTNVMIILREKSIWLATKQPIATEPFNFVAAVPGRGCTAPYSTAVVPGGIAYVDTLTQRVNIYIPGQEPESIGESIENQLFRAILDPEDIQGSYNARYMEYSILLPYGTARRVWTFNFRTKAWTYEELPNVSCINDVTTLSQEITIDSLSGSIDNLSGTIDSLAETSPTSSIRVYGLTDGDIVYQDESTTGLQGTALTATVIGKNHYIPVQTQGVMKMKFEFIVKSPSTINLYYSKDSGVTWTLAKSEYFTPSDETQLLIFHKYIRARKFTWKIESALSSGTGRWELIDYEVHLVPSGKTVRDY